jgi:hypothetical protein
VLPAPKPDFGPGPMVASGRREIIILGLLIKTATQRLMPPALGEGTSWRVAQQPPPPNRTYGTTWDAWMHSLLRPKQWKGVNGYKPWSRKPEATYLRKRGWGNWLHSAALDDGAECSCEHGNAPKVRVHVSNYQHVKNDPYLQCEIGPFIRLRDVEGQ